MAVGPQGLPLGVCNIIPLHTSALDEEKLDIHPWPLSIVWRHLLDFLMDLLHSSQSHNRV